ncbi:hypothetical protein [Methylobacterium haplocladii]|uniref:Uncharacterized protein n=1 Tax=Methylobacterium haplocladii TaxID=1176176 RepID=A0A512IPD5_9HYPH|nr:hypothetical protein [Methylobacterium haplocladii]GEO99498.1 hypothetical protein MHA02_18860 [Methylobacterium haplocladii]GLS59764.1 hypothetical protein GCM10007887_24360 [Methylobacterium haplocladii]
MSDQKPKPIPKYPAESEAPAFADGAATVVEIIGDGLPVVGYLKERMLDRYVRGPLERKRADFHTRIAEGLARLEAKFENFDPNSLENNEDFVAAVFAATQAAMRSSSETQRDALCNVVLNIAAGLKLDEVLRGAFMGYVETFSALHIEVLRIFDDPSRLASLAGANATLQGPIKGLIGKKLVPGIASQEALDRVLDDLENAGMTAETFAVTVAQGSKSASTLKPAGKAFLRFISSAAE